MDTARLSDALRQLADTLDKPGVTIRYATVESKTDPVPGSAPGAAWLEYRPDGVVAVDMRLVYYDPANDHTAKDGSWQRTPWRMDI